MAPNLLYAFNLCCLQETCYTVYLVKVVMLSTLPAWPQPYPSSDSSGCESSIEDGGTPNSSAWRRSSMAAGAAAASLVELARLRGSRDDITANISLFHWAPDQYSAAAAGPMNGQRAAGGSSDQDDGDCPFEGTGAAFAGGCDGHASQQE
jgi:hypothetical protein